MAVRIGGTGNSTLYGTSSRDVMFGDPYTAENPFGISAAPPAYGSSRHSFADRGLQGGEGWTRTLGRAWTRRSAPTTPAQAGPRPSAAGGACRRAASRTRC